MSDLGFDATVQQYLGRPVLHVDGRPIPFNAYSPTRRELFFDQTRRFFDHDTRVFFINVPRAKSDDFGAGPFWVGDQVSDRPMLDAATPTLDQQADFILQHKPDAWLFVRFGNGEPASWRQIHRDQLFVTETGEVIECPSLASTRFVRTCAEMVEAVIRHCEHRPWGPRVIGYWTGMRIEGTHEPLMHGWLYDHSGVMVAAWRRFLRDKYHTDQAIQRAWNDPTVTLDRVVVPTDLLRRSTPEVAQLHFFQPATANQRFRDYLGLQRTLFAEQLRALAAAHRRATRRRRVFVVDALKQVMQGWDNLSFFDPGRSQPLAYHDMLAGSGHIEVAQLLHVDGIDGLVTPHDYQCRGIGGVYEPEAPADTLVARGKLMLSEMDTRSYTGVDGPVFFSARHHDEFQAITWRNVATTITRGFHSYYMDVHTDWFGDEQLHQIIDRQMRVQADAIDTPHHDMPGIAVVIDDAAVLETNGDGRYAHEAIMWQMKTGLARCGIPVRTYLLADLADAALPDHRVWYFPNLFRIDDQRWGLLRQKVLGRGRTVVWGPGSGISDGQTLSADHAARLTGFHFDFVDANAPRRFTITNFDHPITVGLQNALIVGSPTAFGPMLLPRDGVELGRAWVKQGRRNAGLALTDCGQGEAAWTSIFTITPELPAELWRGIGRAAGAHVYCDTDDHIMVDNRHLAVHAVRPGRRTIRLPAARHIHDLIADRPIGVTDAIQLTVEHPVTALYKLSEPINPTEHA